MRVSLRPIRLNDNDFIAQLIREVFVEFKIDKPGTVYTDPTTDHLFELFQTPDSFYWICEENDRIVGGCGIYPTKGLPEGCAELVKFYLSKDSRGKGIGRLLMEKSMNTARDLGYRQLYLESFPELEKAVSIYEKVGFKKISHSLGDSGHHACTYWAVLDL